ncbi:HMG-box protein STE11-like [Dendronephthya gigantea]|uniref:HMG-box protein STE11-like n=1 Tax=Dendronephthya gigantea TaxID=151771 RepID=UPI00106C120E|nr:HMG-box protein STE11-like [Dendronephthya gigantea]
MVENPEAMTMLKSSYEANPAISEAVTNILHSSDLTSLSALAHRDETSREKEPRVKRPMNAFMLYAQVARRKVATKYPNLNYAKLSKTLGKIWQVLPEEERRPFIQEAERLRTQHKLKHPDYKYTPKRLKAKKHHGAPMKKARLDNLKPEDLFNIIQAKCDPGSLQLSTSTSGYPLRYEEQFPVYSNNTNNNNFDNSLYPGQAFDPLAPLNNFDSQFQGLEYLGFPNRRFNNGFHSEMATNNDVKSYFPDYNDGQLLDTFNNPISPLTPKPSPLNSNQPLSTFLASKPETSTTLTPLTNTFGEGLSFSKLIDPIENISSFLEGKSQLPGYVSI